MKDFGRFVDFDSAGFSSSALEDGTKSTGSLLCESCCPCSRTGPLRGNGSTPEWEKSLGPIDTPECLAKWIM
jgi:hypothetical protein